MHQSQNHSVTSGRGINQLNPIDSLVDWLIHWLLHRLLLWVIQWLIDSLVDSLVGSLVASLVDSLVGAPVGSMVDSLADDSPGSLNGSLVHSMVRSMVHSMIVPLIASMVHSMKYGSFPREPSRNALRGLRSWRSLSAIPRNPPDPRKALRAAALRGRSSQNSLSLSPLGYWIATSRKNQKNVLGGNGPSGGSAVGGVWKDAHRVEIKTRWSYDSKKYAFLQILTKTQILFAKSII